MDTLHQSGNHPPPPVMAKEKTESKEERRARKAEKQATKTAGSGVIEDTGVNGTSKHKSEKKGNKYKKERKALAEKALNEIQGTEPQVKKAVKEESDDEAEDKPKSKLANRPIGALVPFAHPLADEKVGKRCFKAVKRGLSQYLKYGHC